MMQSKSRSWLVWVGLALMACAPACNAVLGLEEGELDAITVDAAAAASEDSPAADAPWPSADSPSVDSNSGESASETFDVSRDDEGADGFADSAARDEGATAPETASETAPACTKSESCVTPCKTIGVRKCIDGRLTDCTPPKEICDRVDNDCNGKVDELECGHDVVCEVFDNGYTNRHGPLGSVYVPGAGAACIPSGTAPGLCGRWFGLCKTLPAADGHTHDVRFSLFDDGYARMTDSSDAILVDAFGHFCMPGGTGICRRWFGRGVTNTVQSHAHEIRCNVFDDGPSEVSGPTDAIFFDAGALCTPSGECRKWFHCRSE
jgi:hypothetical protein